MSDIQEVIENQTIIGDPSVFAIGYAFIGEERTTEMAMYSEGVNLLGFTKEGCRYTTRWLYLEGLVAWLKRFACDMAEDGFPVEADGTFASERISAAHDLGPEDDDEFFDYILPVHDWAHRHGWTSERGGAILSNVYFELRGDMVELSWDNRDPEDGVAFDCEFGGVRVEPDTFRSVVLAFVDVYERHWGIKVDDDATWARQ